MAASASTIALLAAQPGAYRPLLAGATLLALGVLTLGAYVRLTDAGLGCPDWPGCYGQLIGVPEHAADIGRAWREMIHRYAAGTLGLLIGALTIAAWRRDAATGEDGPAARNAPWLVSGLCALVVFQAALGMWTVTELLQPLVVTAHLLGGMLLWTLLITLCQREFALPSAGATGRLGQAALLVVFIQVALGGWVSSHYAGLACPDFPTCQGGWWPQNDAALIHFAHRLGALAVLLVVGSYALALRRHPAGRPFGNIIAAGLAVQLLLGVANVLLQLPLALALAHHLGAVVLLAALVASIDWRPSWAN